MNETVTTSMELVSKEQVEELQDRIRGINPNDMPKTKFKLLSSKQIELTKAKAAHFLKMPQFDGERLLDIRHAATLCEKWMAGLFIWQIACIVTAFCKATGHIYRLNGQHCCWFVKEIPIEKMANLTKPIVNELLFEVGTIQELKILYAQCDRNKARSQGHILAVLLRDTSATRGVGVSIINNLCSGFKHWKQAGNHNELRNPEKLHDLILDEYAVLFSEVGKFYQENAKDYRPVHKSQIVGAMFETFDVNVLKATEFWTVICNGLNIASKTSPVWVLRKYLEDNINTASAKAAGRQAATSESQYKACIHLYNKWIKGETVPGGMRFPEKRVRALSA